MYNFWTDPMIAASYFYPHTRQVPIFRGPHRAFSDLTKTVAVLHGLVLVILAFFPRLVFLQSAKFLDEAGKRVLPRYGGSFWY